MLDDILVAYSAERDVGRATLLQYRFAAADFARWLGREILPTDWTDSAVNAYLTDLKGRVRPYTARQRRANLLVLWRFSYQLGLVPEAPRRVKQFRRVELVRQTWTPEDLGRLLSRLDELKGHLRGTEIPKAVFWRTWVMVGWDSGLRPVDQFGLLRSVVLPSGGQFDIEQSKTGRVHHVAFRPSTMQAVQELCQHHAGPFVFPQLWKANHFSKAFRTVVGNAGFQGTPKKLRSSSATEVERAYPGQAWRHLGHSTPSVAVRHYLGSRAWPDVPLPPAPEAG